MGNVLVVYGSTTGTCQAIAKTIASKFDATAIDVTKMTKEAIEQCDTLILGSSTWGYGELQDDWYDGVNVLKSANIAGKKVALYGCGDAQCYDETFCDAMGLIYKEIKDSGCNIVGAVSVDDYLFSGSAAVVDGQFVGLALDDVNEDDKTQERIDNWVASL
ncbi:MAG: flavodoxin FldA [Rikenellaceae bacterium]